MASIAARRARPHREARRAPGQSFGFRRRRWWICGLLLVEHLRERLRALETDTAVRPVAERFFDRSAAAAQCHRGLARLERRNRNRLTVVVDQLKVTRGDVDGEGAVLTNLDYERHKSPLERGRADAMIVVQEADRIMPCRTRLKRPDPIDHRT